MSHWSSDKLLNKTMIHFKLSRPEQAELEWLNDNTMKTVLLRHYPQLEPAVGKVGNAFAPWAKVA
jgi:hypothetical protein